MQFGGLGQLCDGVLGGDDFIQTKELRVWPGYDYLGWSREALGKASVDIEFHFEKPRVFHNMQVGSGRCVFVCDGACVADCARVMQDVVFPLASGFLKSEMSRWLKPPALGLGLGLQGDHLSKI